MVSDEERKERLDALTELIELIRPAVQSDGGDLILIDADVETGVVEVQLQGACSSCAVSTTTLQAGVNRILKERLEWVTEVLGTSMRTWTSKPARRWEKAVTYRSGSSGTAERKGGLVEFSMGFEAQLAHPTPSGSTS